jgi:hypothetical protein
MLITVAGQFKACLKVSMMAMHLHCAPIQALATTSLKGYAKMNIMTTFSSTLQEGISETSQKILHIPHLSTHTKLYIT